MSFADRSLEKKKSTSGENPKVLKKGNKNLLQAKEMYQLALLQVTGYFVHLFKLQAEETKQAELGE